MCVLVEQGCGGNPAGLVDGCAVGFNETLNLGNVSQDQLGFAKAELERPFGVGGGFKDKHGVALVDVDFGGGCRSSGGRFGFQFHLFAWFDWPLCTFLSAWDEQTCACKFGGISPSQGGNF